MIQAINEDRYLNILHQMQCKSVIKERQQDWQQPNKKFYTFYKANDSRFLPGLLFFPHPMLLGGLATLMSVNISSSIH